MYIYSTTLVQLTNKKLAQLVKGSWRYMGSKLRFWDAYISAPNYARTKNFRYSESSESPLSNEVLHCRPHGSKDRRTLKILSRKFWAKNILKIHILKTNPSICMKKFIVMYLGSSYLEKNWEVPRLKPHCHTLP